MGTAPRRPAHDRNARSRHGIGRTTELATTETGRASTVRIRPASRASPTISHEMRSGESSSPSITNSPICASQATPSANDRVAPRCGSSELPSTSAATYTAANPDACTNAAAPYARRASVITAIG